jgi:hypothetical protein
MKYGRAICRFLAALCLLPLGASAQVQLLPGEGIGPLKIGQSYEEVVSILGFKGKLKTYSDYVAEVLFSENPSDFLECRIGFDYYVRYEHLLTLPVSYVFYEDDKINQIMVSSLPAYYRDLARDVQTPQGLAFWSTDEAIRRQYGAESLLRDYPGFMTTEMFYFSKGLGLQLRNREFRNAHIFKPPDAELQRSFARQDD